MRKSTCRDDWPTLKGNNSRNSQSFLPGKTVRPKILNQVRFGNYKGYFQLIPDPDDTSDEIAIPEGTSQNFQSIEEKYKFNGLFYSVNGETIQRHQSANDRLFHLYSPDELNLISVSEGLSLHESVNSMTVYRVIDSQMNTEKLWEVTFPFYIERPHILVADMDGDGVLDIIVEGWAGIVVYNSVTKERIMEFPQEELHNSRKRGYVLARDLNGNGFPDIVILSCYPWDVNVISNDGKKLSKQWFKIYDNHIESAQVITRYTREPIADYDGDGRFEMVFNIWNEQGDGQWHVKVLDAWTGEEKLDLPRSYLIDSVDIDRDGMMELFLSASTGIDVPEFSTISIYHLRKGVLFSEDNAKWGYWCDSVENDSLALHPGQNPKPGLFSLVTPEDMSCCFYYVNDGTQTKIFRFDLSNAKCELFLKFARGVNIELIRFQADGTALLSLETKRDHPVGIQIPKRKVLPLCWGIPADQRISLPVIADLGGESNSLVLANGVGQIVRFDMENGVLEEKWAVDGFGAAEQYCPTIDFGVIADDFLGRGTSQVVARINGHGGGVKLVDEHGETVWVKEFDLIPSGQPCGFSGILGFFTSAQANGKKYVIVSGQRNVQHTGITFGLEGSTGKEAWKLDVVNEGQYYQSGAGSFYLTAWDMDGDGVDEVTTGYGNNLWAAHADTGEVIFANFMRAFWEPLWIKNYPFGWVSSISPIPLSRSKTHADLFFGCAGDSHGAGQVVFEDGSKALDDRCTLKWGNKEHDFENRSNQCLFQFEDMTLVAEPAVHHGRAVLHVVDPVTGSTESPLWYTGGSTPAVPLSCDIDGDGRQEIVYTSGRKLAAVRFSKEGWEEVFQMEFDNHLSWPVYGDVNGDGFGELAVTDSAGTLYVIG